MDKFEEFLNKKIEEETKEFFVPESFNLKIEETLESLPKKNDDNKRYFNKKILGSVACFAFICLLGSGVITNRYKNNNNDYDVQMAMDRSANVEDMMPQSYSMDQVETTVEADAVILDVNEIESINFKSLKDKAKYKFINNIEDVKKIIGEINFLSIEEINKQNIKEWDFLIQTNGRVNHSIMIKNNYINIDEKWYQSNYDISEQIKEIYSNMNYEEKDIKYCNVN